MKKILCMGHGTQVAVKAWWPLVITMYSSFYNCVIFNMLRPRLIRFASEYIVDLKIS